MVKKHFVTFFSPGTFVAEQSTQEIESWDVKEACARAKKITERHGATPYGFQFSTRSRGPNDLDSKISATSPMYYLGGKIETLAEVKARATDKDRILVGNMERNNIKRILTNSNSWKWTQPLGDDDIVLQWP